MKAKIISLIARLRIIKYRLINILCRIGIYSLKNKNKEIPVIVSITSYPKRFRYVYMTIESLFNQTMRPNKIVLWLTKDEISNVEIPKSLKCLEKRGLEIKVVEKNFKAYNKLIFSMKLFNGKNIITCDDDILYPTYFLEEIYKKHKEFPDSIVAYRCTVIQKEEGKKLSPYITWRPSKDQGPSYKLFPTGVGGVLYPPNSLHEDVFNDNLFLKFSPLNDDIWFKAMALLKKTKTVMVDNHSKEFPIIQGTQETALWHTNVSENMNDVQLKDVFDYYDLYHMLEE